jgi:hypothetical protein
MRSIHVALIALAAGMLVETDVAGQTRPMGVHATETGSSRSLGRSAEQPVVALQVMENGRLCDRTAATCRSVRAEQSGNFSPKLFYYAKAFESVFGNILLEVQILSVMHTSNRTCDPLHATTFPHEFLTPEKWALFDKRNLMAHAYRCSEDPRPQFTLRWRPADRRVPGANAELTSEVLFLVR